MKYFDQHIIATTLALWPMPMLGIKITLACKLINVNVMRNYCYCNTPKLNQKSKERDQKVPNWTR